MAAKRINTKKHSLKFIFFIVLSVVLILSALMLFLVHYFDNNEEALNQQETSEMVETEETSMTETQTQMIATTGDGITIEDNTKEKIVKETKYYCPTEIVIEEDSLFTERDEYINLANLQLDIGNINVIMSPSFRESDIKIEELKLLCENGYQVSFDIQSISDGDIDLLAEVYNANYISLLYSVLFDSDEEKTQEYLNNNFGSKYFVSSDSLATSTVLNDLGTTQEEIEEYSDEIVRELLESASYIATPMEICKENVPVYSFSENIGEIKDVIGDIQEKLVNDFKKALSNAKESELYKSKYTITNDYVPLFTVCRDDESVKFSNSSDYAYYFVKYSYDYDSVLKTSYTFNGVLCPDESATIHVDDDDILYVYKTTDASFIEEYGINCVKTSEMPIGVGIPNDSTNDDGYDYIYNDRNETIYVKIQNDFTGKIEKIELQQGSMCLFDGSVATLSKS